MSALSNLFLSKLQPLLRRVVFLSIVGLYIDGSRRVPNLEADSVLGDDCGGLIRVRTFVAARIHCGCDVVVRRPGLDRRIGVSESGNQRGVHLCVRTPAYCTT